VLTSRRRASASANSAVSDESFPVDVGVVPLAGFLNA
jgi:hypothetical protein